MRLEQLEYFVAVAEMHSMTLASNLLNVTHQNTSKALKQLEEELGVALLNRSRQGITLTEIGAQVYRCSKQMLELEKNIYQLAAPLAGPKKQGELLHFLLTPAFYGLFTAVMNQFSATHPGLCYFPEYKEPMYVTDKLLLSETSAQMICTMLENGVFLEKQEDLQKLFDIHLIRQEPIVLITGNLSQLKKKSAVSLKELEGISLAVYCESLEYDNFFIDCLKRYGFKSANIAVSGTSEFCGQALENATAATVGTEFSFNHSAILPRLNSHVRILAIKPRIEVDHAIFVRKDAPLILHEFAQHFKKICSIN